ncbi:TIGR03899 family protein [Paraglaciecola aestuariivivens]
MKISHKNSPSVVPAVTVEQPTQPKKSAATDKAEKKVERSLELNRMTKWFAQIGIQASDHQAKPLSTTEKASRKASLIAQRKVQNLESILAKALDLCIADCADEDIDADWFFSFVHMAEQVYSPAMQDLWGKIFAVESAKPGSFSLKTLSILQQLTQKDAQTFQLAVSLASKRKGESVPKLLMGYYQKPSLWSLFHTKGNQLINLAEFGLGYPDILSLMDLGLIHHSEIESGELPTEKSYEWRCTRQTMQIRAKRAGTSLKYYKFTTSGAELCKLVPQQKQDAYLIALTHTLNSAFEVN